MALINIHYVLQFSEEKITNICRIKKLSKFYQEILCSFNECKANPVKMFQYKGNTLLFKNWVTCGVLHVKNLLNENGNFKALEEYRNIENKSNWLCEYKVLSTVFKILCRKYDFSNSDFVNILYRDIFQWLYKCR